MVYNTDWADVRLKPNESFTSRAYAVKFRLKFNAD